MPKLQHAPIISLCPTQLTVGFLEVDAKKKKLQALSPKDQAAFLAAHPMPVVLGPGQRMYITDHHHLARAAYDLKIQQACFEVEDDLSALAQDIFWIHMDKESWVHPLDQHGVRHRYESIPKSLDKLGGRLRTRRGRLRQDAHRICRVHLGGFLQTQYRH